LTPRPTPHSSRYWLPLSGRSKIWQKCVFLANYHLIIEQFLDKNIIIYIYFWKVLYNCVIFSFWCNIVGQVDPLIVHSYNNNTNNNSDKIVIQKWKQNTILSTLFCKQHDFWPICNIVLFVADSLPFVI